ncbi:MAG: RsmD family RNA methyltransferase [bacterium]
MRIVSGKHKGLPLQTPSHKFRPTTGVVREAVFDILRARMDFKGKIFADIFAGSGAVGFEALSEGFSRAAFVELSGKACGVMKKNIKKLGFESCAEVFRYDGFSLDAVVEKISPDVMFVDPPYHYHEKLNNSLDSLFDTKENLPLYIIAESDVPLSASSENVKKSEKEYGKTLLTIYSSLL